jgi:hypothetical protein
MKSYLLLLLTFLLQDQAQAQDYSRLGKLEKERFTVYFSNGYQARASEISNLVDTAFTYFTNQLSFQPKVDLLVLAEADWNTYSRFRVVYGMPHYDDQRTLIVAAQDNPFWKSFIPPLSEIPERWKVPIKSTYSRPDGSISASAFFDILALHELSHAFHMQANINMQRKWMGELFCNIMTHSFVAEKKPQLLPALTVFPNFIVSGGYQHYKFTSLEELEKNYTLIGQEFPQNYGWYQCNWHKAAGHFYDQHGPAFGQQIWKAFKSQPIRFSDADWKTFLKAHQLIPLVKLMENWPDFGP